jgi:lipopolysaccharide/colanic/teichoic acid biosynthesis glycosyltransferase
VKRALDVVLAALALAAAAPLIAAAAVAVRLSSPGPVLYASPRVGRDGRTFGMLKLRTMVAGADRRGPLVTAAGDARVTPVGRVLRRTKIDELPSLWNVVRGDMSLVGPRPENPGSAALYSAEQRRLFGVRPGITSPATIAYRHEERLLAGGGDVETRYLEIMQRKLALELDYVARRSLWLDLRILARTLWALLR